MKKFESFIIKLITWSILPLSFFFIFWWVFASLQIYNIINISDKYIAIAAFSGVGIGLIITAFTNKYLNSNFYNFSYKYLALLYIFISSIGFAIMMGIPICILLLGIISGIYIGRRSYFAGVEKGNNFRRVSLFSSIVTGFWILFICLLARTDGEIHQILEKFAGINEATILGPPGFLGILLITIFFVLIQYYLTNTACKVSYKLSL